MHHDMFRPILECARQAAGHAGAYIHSRFRTIGDSDVEEKGRNDFVTQVDRDAEEIIRGVLGHAFPDHAVLAEEGGATQAASEWIWVVDPLDGTTNFIHGFPHYAVSLGLVHDGRPVFGLVLNVEQQEWFYAGEGCGCFFNDQPLRVTDKAELNGAFAATGFPFRNPEMIEAYSGLFESFMHRVRDVRRAGSAALDLAYVAAGRFDFFFEAFLQPWDFTAGTVLITEAGGRVSNFAGMPPALRPDSIAAANPRLWRIVLDEVQRFFPPDNPLS